MWRASKDERLRSLRRTIASCGPNFLLRVVTCGWSGKCPNDSRCHYLPLKSGVRFSLKAARPSSRSSVICSIVTISTALS